VFRHKIMSKKKIPERNMKGRKLFRKQDDSSLRQDKETGMWIRHRKTTYLYWYKFLQVCLKEGYKVDKSKYRGWDINTIADTKFDDWWESHKRKLFYVKERTGTPKVQLSTPKPKREYIRMSWLVYCYDSPDLEGIDIAYKIIKRECINRYLTNSNQRWFPIKKDGLPLDVEKIKTYKRDLGLRGHRDLRKKKNKTNDEILYLNNLDALLKYRNRISKAITEHRMNANKILEHVCNGQFP